MFDPDKETQEGWENDIRDDVISEISKFGGALHVYIDKNSKDGVVYVMASSNDTAVAASKKIHGTYFDSKLKRNKKNSNILFFSMIWLIKLTFSTTR